MDKKDGRKATCRWHGRGILLGQQGRNWWLVHRGQAIRADPCQLRHTSQSEKYADENLEECLRQAQEMADGRGQNTFVDITKEEKKPLPPLVRLQGVPEQRPPAPEPRTPVPAEPAPAPLVPMRRLTGKRKAEHLVEPETRRQLQAIAAEPDPAYSAAPPAPAANAATDPEPVPAEARTSIHTRGWKKERASFEKCFSRMRTYIARRHGLDLALPVSTLESHPMKLCGVHVKGPAWTQLYMKRVNYTACYVKQSPTGPLTL